MVADAAVRQCRTTTVLSYRHLAAGVWLRTSYKCPSHSLRAEYSDDGRVLRWTAAMTLHIVREEMIMNVVSAEDIFNVLSVL